MKEAECMAQTAATSKLPWMYNDKTLQRSYKWGTPENHGTKDMAYFIADETAAMAALLTDP